MPKTMQEFESVSGVEIKEKSVWRNIYRTY